MERLSRTELLIRQRTAALARGLAGARKGDVSAVHHARVATRRLREALPLVASGAAARKVSRVAKRLTRALGPVRQLDVELLTLAEIERGRDVPRRAVECLAEVVADERRALHAELVREIDRVDVDTVRRRAAAAARRCDSDRTQRGRAERIARSRQRAARRADRLRAAIDVAAGMYVPERLHQVRIAVKKLRYTLEVVRELSGSRALATIRTLKRIQDLLGRLHDLEVLIVRTRAVQGSAKAPDLQLSADLDQLVRRLENECRQLHAHYITLRKALLDVCDQVTAARARRAAAA